MAIHYKLFTDYFCKAHTSWKNFFIFLYALYAIEYFYNIRVIRLRQLIQILEKQTKIESQPLQFLLTANIV